MSQATEELKYAANDVRLRARLERDLEAHQKTASTAVDVVLIYRAQGAIQHIEKLIRDLDASKNLR